VPGNESLGAVEVGCQQRDKFNVVVEPHRAGTTAAADATAELAHRLRLLVRTPEACRARFLTACRHLYLRGDKQPTVGEPPAIRHAREPCPNLPIGRYH
jgi:hypothetical protein